MGKAGLCKGCKRQERREWTVKRVGELVQGAPEKYKYEMVSHEQVRREIQPVRREAGNRAKPYEEDVCTGLKKEGITHLMANNQVCWAEKKERWEEECGCGEAGIGAEECEFLCRICACRRSEPAGKRQGECMRCADGSPSLEWCTGCGKAVHNACIPACWRRGAGQQDWLCVECGTRFARARRALVEQPEWVSKSKRAHREEELVMVGNAIRYGNRKRYGGGAGGETGVEVGSEENEALEGEEGRNGGKESARAEDEAMVEGQVESGPERVGGGRREQGGTLCL